METGRKEKKSKMGVRGQIRGSWIERKHHVWGEREADSKVRGWGCGGREGETGGPGGGINEAIDLSVRHTSAVLSLSSLIYSHHQHGMDFLPVASRHLHEREQDGRRHQGRGGGGGGGMGSVTSQYSNWGITLVQFCDTLWIFGYNVNTDRKLGF